MTFEMWKQRFIGAYQAIADCSAEDAEGAALCYAPDSVDVVADCPVESARAAVSDDIAQGELEDEAVA